MTNDAEARIAALEERLRRLEDLAAIQQIVMAYGPAADSGSLTEAPALWEENGIYDVSGLAPMEGRAAIEEMLRGPGHQGAIGDGCAHILTPPQITLDGDEATGRSHSIMIRWNAEAQQFFVFRLSSTVWHWRRTAEGWRIANRTNRLLDGKAAARELFANPAPRGV